MQYQNPDGTIVDVTLGDYVKLGKGVILGDYVTLGDSVILGKGVKLGDDVTLGDYVKLGDGVTLGDNVTSSELNEMFRNCYKELNKEHIFTKWVTKNRMSPNFDGGTPIKYDVNATIECPDAKISDQQCDIGLHVFRFGYRPEWSGLCSAEHTLKELMPIRVKVLSEDICFAGLPSCDEKLRVRKLVVLD